MSTAIKQPTAEDFMSGHNQYIPRPGMLPSQTQARVLYAVAAVAGPGRTGAHLKQVYDYVLERRWPQPEGAPKWARRPADWGPSDSTVFKRLRDLCIKGYLEKVARPDGSPGYRLNEKGRVMLSYYALPETATFDFRRRCWGHDPLP